MKALSRNNENPERASRPWDKNRDGFVMSDGGGVLVLEEYEHAKNRGAKIYAEILGFGLSGDANHIAAPHPEGEGAFKAMCKALKMAGKDPTEIDYINAHGTSTPTGDMIELNAIKRLFGNTNYNFGMSSTKSSIGHALGAAGSIEAILSILAMRDSVMPPTINLEDPEEDAKCFNLVQNTPQEKNVSVVMSNSFGFGGTNITLIMGKC
jgi:3-oxoacyl-[acyl-carrier-protein] synthase II